MLVTDRISLLCYEYQYPPFIETSLRECCREFRSINPTSIFLIGSASRGELSWTHWLGVPDVLSDLEFLLFLDTNLDPKQLTQLKANLSKVTETVPHANPHFHIDFSILLHKQAPKVSRNLAFFEMQASGKLLEGSNTDLALLPKINVQNLNIQELNHLVLVRLWWLLAGIPKEIIDQNPTDYTSFLLHYISCRNILDVPTILLPNEGHLIAGYSSRLQFLESHYLSLTSSRYMGENFSKQIAEAVRGKQELEFAGSPIQHYRETLDAYVRLIRSLLQTETDIPVDRLTKRLALNGSIFDYSFLSRKRLRPIFFYLAHFLRIRTPSNFKRIFTPVESTLLATLLAMHFALYHLLSEDEERASVALTDAKKYLERIYPLEYLDIDDGKETLAQQWLRLRYRVADAVCSFYGVFHRRREFIANMLDWVDSQDYGAK